MAVGALANTESCPKRPRRQSRYGDQSVLADTWGVADSSGGPCDLGASIGVRNGVAPEPCRPEGERSEL